VRRELLQSTRAFWSDFIDQTDSDPRVAYAMARAFDQLGTVECELGNPEAGIDAFGRAAELLAGAESEPARAALCRAVTHLAGERFQQQGATAEVRAVYERGTDIARGLVDDFPGNPDYRAHLAGLTMSGWIFGAGHRALWDAIRVAESILVEHPDHREARLVIAHASNNLSIGMKNGDVEGAIRAALRAVENYGVLARRNPDSIESRNFEAMAYLNLGVAYSYDHRWAEAREAYDRAYRNRDEQARRYPANPDFRAEAAVALAHMRIDTPQATLDRAQRILDLCEPLASEFPEDRFFVDRAVDGYRIRAQSYYRMGNVGEALRYHLAAARPRGEYRAAPNWEHALCYYHLGQRDEAEQLFRACIAAKQAELASVNPHPKADLAQMLATCPVANLRNPIRAVELAEEAAKASPCRREEWQSLGYARLRSGLDREALLALERGDAGILPDLAYARALARARLGETALAADLFAEGEARRKKLQWQGRELMALREEVRGLLAE
jgi:tetratricopeptide (TPR) repeat protein